MILPKGGEREKTRKIYIISSPKTRILSWLILIMYTVIVWFPPVQPSRSGRLRRFFWPHNLVDFITNTIHVAGFDRTYVTYKWHYFAPNFNLHLYSFSISLSHSLLLSILWLIQIGERNNNKILVLRITTRFCRSLNLFLSIIFD